MKKKTFILSLILSIAIIFSSCNNSVESQVEVVTLSDLHGNWIVTKLWPMNFGPDTLFIKDTLEYSTEIDSDYYNAFFISFDNNYKIFNAMITGYLNTDSVEIVDNGNGTFIIYSDSSDTNQFATSFMKASRLGEKIKLHSFGKETTNTVIDSFEQVMIISPYEDVVPFDLWESGLVADSFEIDNHTISANLIKVDSIIVGHNINEYDSDFYEIYFDSTIEYVISVQSECLMSIKLQILDFTEKICKYSADKEDFELLNSLGPLYNIAMKFTPSYSGKFYILVSEYFSQQGQYILTVNQSN